MEHERTVKVLTCLVLSTAGLALSGCASGGVIGAPIFARAPVVEGAQPPASPEAAIGRAQSYAGMQATEAQSCGVGMVPADRVYNQEQDIEQRVELGAGRRFNNGNRISVQTQTRSAITCVPKVRFDFSGVAPRE